MPIPMLAIMVIAGASLGCFCSLCILRPERIAESARRRYERSSKFAQKFPFSNMVMKSWYPTYLRAMGSFGLIFIFIWFYLAVINFSK
jgi:hypothetical protein